MLLSYTYSSNSTAKKDIKIYEVLFEDNVNDVRNVFERFTYEWWLLKLENHL